MNPANLDRVTKAVIAVVAIGGLALKKLFKTKLMNNNGNQ